MTIPNIDIYAPKTMRGIIRKSYPLRTFFKSRFFTNPVLFPTETVSFEFQDSKRRLAPYVNPKVGSESIERDEYEIVTYRPPLVAPERAITNDTLAQKLLGEAIWNSGLTPEDRAVQIAAQDIVDLMDSIYRREEYMCARVKQDGKLDIKGKGVNYTVPYGFENIIETGASDKWMPTYNIQKQLGAIGREMQKDGINPDMLILGSDAAIAFCDNEPLLKLLDIRRVEMGEIKPASLENGVRYIGRMITPEITLEVYCYSEWYPDDQDLDEHGRPKLKPIVDPATAIMQSSTESNSILYGSITLMDERSEQHMTYMDTYVPDKWVTKKPAQKFISVSSRPLPMPHDLKSWTVLKNVVS